MTKEQLKRANGAVFPIVVIIMAYLLLTLGAYILTSDTGANWRTYTQAAAAFLNLIIAIIAYLTKREERLGAMLILGSAAAAIFVITILNTTNGTYAYAFPILFAAMAFLNEKIIVIGASVIFLANGIKMLLCYSSADSEGQSSLFLSLMIVALVSYAAIRVIKLLIRFNQENMKVITDAADRQEESNKRMTAVAEDIMKNFELAQEKLVVLNASIGTSSTAMKHIAESTDSTAQAILQQADMCSEIQTHTDEVEISMKEMIEVSQRTGDTVAEGASVVNDLNQQAQHVSAASSETVEVISRLNERVEEVQGFVGTILEISSQTNLLALNASIEAARAGEAGRGFAVVADEIRQLSEQTQTASNHITSIIKELMEDTKRVTDSARNSVDSVTRQNELIESTGEKFRKVNEEVEALARNIVSSEAVVENILKSTGIISENIKHLSSASEEIAAASGEGIRTSEQTVSDMKSCGEILSAIYGLATDLKQSDF